MELATIRRYLSALDTMRSHPNEGVRAYAQEIIDTMVSHPIHEVLKPIDSLPIGDLTQYERVFRILAVGR